jgi:hypothetical protein
MDASEALTIQIPHPLSFRMTQWKRCACESEWTWLLPRPGRLREDGYSADG